MQPSPIRDFIVGLFVLAGLGAIAYLSIQVGGLSYKGPGGLELIASFDEIGGLATRAPVSISGVKVGQVARIELDPALRARVTLDLDKSLALPVDTQASIRTAGLLGDQFIALEPGAEDQLLKSGEEIAFTESALSIERLIGKFVNNTDLDKKDKDGDKEAK
jgi:phospholipid/cholesterol/gamma-HCH transport system substrate-binding protein